MAEDDQGTRTVADIVSSIRGSSDEELGALAGDTRKGVQDAVAAERHRRGVTTEDDIIRRAQANTGRPPAHEVSKRAGEALYGDLPHENGDPDLLAAGSPENLELYGGYDRFGTGAEGGDS